MGSDINIGLYFRIAINLHPVSSVLEKCKIANWWLTRNISALFKQREKFTTFIFTSNAVISVREIFLVISSFNSVCEPQLSTPFLH
jgi:hypothetical protein